MPKNEKASNAENTDSTKLTQEELSDISEMMEYFSKLKNSNVSKTLIGNYIGKSGMLVEDSFFEGMTSEEKRAHLLEMHKAEHAHQLNMYKLQLECIINAGGADAGIANKAKALLEDQSSPGNALIMNAVDGILWGNKTASEAMQNVVKLYKAQFANTNTNQHGGGVSNTITLSPGSSVGGNIIVNMLNQNTVNTETDTHKKQEESLADENNILQKLGMYSPKGHSINNRLFFKMAKDFTKELGDENNEIIIALRDELLETIQSIKARGLNTATKKERDAIRDKIEKIDNVRTNRLPAPL